MSARPTPREHDPESTEEIIERLIDEVLAHAFDPTRHELMTAANGDRRMLRALVLTGLGLGELARCDGRWRWSTGQAYRRLVSTVGEPLGHSGAAPATIELTQREEEILALLSDGLTARTIGRQLFLSPRTVAKHLERMYRKFGTSDRLSTVLRAQDLGLLQPAAPAPPR